MSICASNYHWSRGDFLPLGGCFDQRHRFDLIYRLCIDETLIVGFKAWQDRLLIICLPKGGILRKHKRIETVIVSALLFVNQWHSFARIWYEGFAGGPPHSSHFTFGFAQLCNHFWLWNLFLNKGATLVLILSFGRNYSLRLRLLLRWYG